MLAAEEENYAAIERAFSEMEKEARLSLRREGFAEARQRHDHSLAVRYQGQSFELEIKWSRGRDITESFHKAHQMRYGYAQTENRVEVVSARLRSTGLVEELKRERVNRASIKRSRARPYREALVHFAVGRKRAGVYDRQKLNPGAQLVAPAVITEYSSTTLIPPGARAHLDEHGNLIIEP
jgi:N-methylhydantoinase A